MTFYSRMLTAMAGIVAIAASVANLKDVIAAEPQSVPTFQVDASWPKLPDKMIDGELHFIATDSHGNLYTAEAQGRRAQKFVAQGLTAVIRSGTT